jgi:capsular exopolysaccharide synthesis family protein
VEQSPFDRESQSGLTIDFKRILSLALRYWYLIVTSLLITLAVAFIRNRYATRIYPVNASILIKETEETGGAELLYKNALIDPYKNYLNEIYILLSTPIVERVIQDLNFEVAFFKEGNLLTTEAYDYFPVAAKVVHSKTNKPQKFRITFLSAEKVKFEPSNGVSEVAPQEFDLKDTIDYNGLKFKILIKDKQVLRSYFEQPFIFYYTPAKDLAPGYAGKVEAVWAEVGAGVINLSINGPNPIKEIDFMSGLIDRFQKYDLERKNQAASRTVDFISKQLTDISDSLKFVEAIMERFKDKNVVTDMNAEALRLYERLESVENQRIELTVRANYYKYLTEYIQKEQELDKVIFPSSIGISDPVLNDLVSTMVNSQMEIKMMLNKEKLDNPLISDRRKRIQAVKGDIIEAVVNQKFTDQIRSNALTKQIKDLEKQLSYLPAAEREFVSIKRNYSLLENLYIFLLQKRAEASISEASNISDVITVNPPRAGGPVSPKVSQNYSIAFLLGLFLPFALFVLVELFDTKVQSKEDIEKITSMPFIGGVGHNKLSTNLVVKSKPKSAVSESFRALRSNLNYFTNNKDRKIVMVTSSVSGEGKTFTSINLATVLAMSGKRTVIIGADMRKPRLYDDFNLDNAVGLSSYLSGLETLESVIQKTDIDNLSLISGGPVPPNPSELLLREKEVEALFRLLKEQFDYILLDTPPVGLVTDAFVLSKYVDHSLFVVRQDYTPKAIIKVIDDYYKDGRVKNISIVLNDIYRSGPGYGYGYGYGYSYGYGYAEKKNGNYYEE